MNIKFHFLLLLLLNVGTRIFAQQNLIYGRDSNNGDVYSLNPTTGVSIPLVNTGTNNFSNNVSCINSDSSWYMFMYSSGGIRLQTVDLNTNTIKYDVIINTAYTKFDYNPNNHLIYALVSNKLYTINPSNGSTIFIATLNSSAVNQATAIDPIRNYYYSLGLGQINGIDLNSGTSLNTIPTIGTVYSIFFNCSTQSLYAFTGDVYKVNTQLGILQLAVSVPFNSYVYGTACSDMQNGFFYFQNGVSPKDLAIINLNTNTYNSITLTSSLSTWQVAGKCSYLYVDAGLNKHLCYPGGNVLLNGVNVKGGSGQYHYKWSPSNLLNNDTIKNPLALVTSDATFYLTIYDSLTLNSSTDSVLVKIIPTLNSVVNKNICAGNSYYFNNRFVQNSGIYYDTLKSYLGCDSFIQLNLFVNQQTSHANYTGFGCNNLSVYNKIYDSTGLYQDTISNYLGCDSVISLNITIDKTKVKFQVIADAFTPHLWYVLNLSEGKSPIKYIWNWGDGTYDTTTLNPQHIYQTEGYYDICLQIIDSAGCSDFYCDTIASYLYRSNHSNSMITVNVVDSIPKPKIIEPEKPSYIHYFPNPTIKFLNFETVNFEIQKIEIWNLMGKLELILQPSITSNKLNISSLGSGIYIIKTIDTKGNQFIDKLNIQE